MEEGQLTYEPTALATDVGKCIPILEGEVAERFIEMAERNYQESLNRREPTIEELKERLSMKKLMLNFEEDRLNNLRKEIKDLEKRINGESC